MSTGELRDFIPQYLAFFMTFITAMRPVSLLQSANDYVLAKSMIKHSEDNVVPVHKHDGNIYLLMIGEILPASINRCRPTK